MKELIKDHHYYYNAEGYVVFTRQYHLEKGYCCGHGCHHCPFEFENVPEPRRSDLFPSTEPLAARKELP